MPIQCQFNANSMPIQCRFNANSMPMHCQCQPIQCYNNAIQCRFDAIPMPCRATSTMRSNPPAA
eukprot:881275-Lingulodinium_polyedra.AAC.1